MAFYICLMIIAQLLASFSQILLKKSSMKEYKSRIYEYLNILVIGGYGMLVVSMLLSILCYGGLGYMRVVMLEPMAYIMVTVLGKFFFGEKITGKKTAGLILILAGIIIFYMG